MDETTSPKPKRQFGCGQVIIIMLLTGLVSAGGMFWWAKRYFYAKELAPVALSTEETQQLDRKLCFSGYYQFYIGFWRGVTLEDGT